MKEYTIGLDIGTNSVGWAVLTDDYKLISLKMKIGGNTEKKQMKKNFWGVRLFDEGQIAEGRRIKRTTRRRYNRRKNRINYLQDIFLEDMKKVDPNFFLRLGESFKVGDDKELERHPIFATLEEEKAYHEKFPTIYHLRKELADSSEKADLRLVYLALTHIVKFRGHFLIEGELNTENTSISKTFKTFLKVYNETFDAPSDNDSDFKPVDETVNGEEILNANFSRSGKAERLVKLFTGEKSTGNLAQFIKMIVGNQGNFKKMFELTEDAKLQVSKDAYDDDLESLLNLIGDEYTDVFTAAKDVYDAVQLSNILTVNDEQTNAKLSSAMIERYATHKSDLEALKKLIKAEVPNKYSEIFKDVTKHGYAGYISGKTDQEAFYKYMKKELSTIEGAQVFIEKIDQDIFLRKQRTFDNGVIPNQIHLKEYQAIIEKQGEFYPFLKENKAKLESLVTFRIPYYVGPLGENSSFSWMTRKEEGAIYPWNFDEKVDTTTSAVAFIEKMTNNDTYLPNEKVLPKHSMLYEKYMVFNELTKVRYEDESEREQNFSGEEKAVIYNQLFKMNRKVSKKLLASFLSNEWQIENPTIKGIETNFNAGLKTYHDFLKIGIAKEILDDSENEEMLEEIVKILTVFEDRKMIRQQLSQYDTILTADNLKKLERRHYTGWGRLSKKLLTGLRDSQSQKTILDYLMVDDGPEKNINRNLMQLINDDELSFKTQIKEATVSSSEDINELVNQLAGSPAIKKGILQSLKIVQELVKIMGYPPKNIVVEMARENQTTATGRNKSKPRLKKLEEAIKQLHSDILKEYPTDNTALQSDRLYLYYLQDGRDMYTGEELEINNLSRYDIDHIIPQSFTTDNSFDNRVLVSSTANREKGDDVPSSKVVNRMLPVWEKLKRAGLISERKFNNLTKIQRGGLTDDLKAEFIKRQLVETRQITKHVAAILHDQFNSEIDEAGKRVVQTKVITLKSALTSQFRKEFELYKVREINDYHHAHDAYLNGVVALTLLKVHPKLAPEFVYGDYPKFNTFKENKATAKKQRYSNMMAFFKGDPISDENGEVLWNKERDMATVRKVLGYRQMNIVKKTEVQKGAFYNESVKPKGPSENLIARKNGLDTSKYGGVDSPTVAYSIVLSHEKGKKAKVATGITGITIMERVAFEINPINFLEKKGFINPKVLTKLPKYTLYEFSDGRRRLLASAKEAQKGNQQVLPNHLVTLLYHAKRSVSEGVDKVESLNYITEHQVEFGELLEHVKQFSEKYTLASKRLEQVITLYERNKEGAILEIAESFVSLLGLNKFGAPSAFKFFGEDVDRHRYTSVGELLQGTIIHQSITGLYESRQKLGE